MQISPLRKGFGQGRVVQIMLLSQHRYIVAECSGVVLGHISFVSKYRHDSDNLALYDPPLVRGLSFPDIHKFIQMPLMALGMRGTDQTCFEMPFVVLYYVLRDNHYHYQPSKTSFVCTIKHHRRRTSPSRVERVVRDDGELVTES